MRTLRWGVTPFRVIVRRPGESKPSAGIYSPGPNRSGALIGKGEAMGELRGDDFSAGGTLLFAF